MAVGNFETLSDLSNDHVIAQDLAKANVNINTGFATNYINHYVEILLVFELLPDMHDCLVDIEEWKPMSYRNHVLESGLPHSDLILKAYDFSDNHRREMLESITAEADPVIASFQDRARLGVKNNDSDALQALAEEAKEFIQPIVSQITHVISAETLSLS